MTASNPTIGDTPGPPLSVSPGPAVRCQVAATTLATPAKWATTAAWVDVAKPMQADHGHRRRHRTHQRHARRQAVHVELRMFDQHDTRQGQATRATSPHFGRRRIPIHDNTTIQSGYVLLSVSASPIGNRVSA